jgi:hypothetical protein
VAQLLGLSTLLLVLAASAPQTDAPQFSTTTARSVAAFGACFANAQEKAGKAWAFMPSASGGTFTNSGAVRSTGAYWLEVHAGTTRGEVRLFGGRGVSPPAPLIEAVKRCS